MSDEEMFRMDEQLTSDGEKKERKKRKKKKREKKTTWIRSVFAPFLFCFVLIFFFFFKDESV